MRFLAFACLLIAFASLSAESKKIRGLEPSKQSLYESSSDGFFTCLDGSKKIPADRVNDDYCDCKDGSDEPGTSACHNGVFFCANKGSSSVSLASAFVDDGLCDCCDGSDEIHGCPNRCLEESAPLLEEMKEKLSVYTSALEKKVSFEQEAVEKKANWQKRSHTIAQEVSLATQTVETARSEKDKAAELRRNAQNDVEYLEAKARQEQEERRLQEEAAAAEHASAQASSDHPEATPDTQAESQGQESSPPQEETDEERGRRIAAQWTTDPDAAASAQAAEDAGDVNPEEEHYDFPNPPHYTPPSEPIVDSPELQEARQLAATLESEMRTAEAKLSSEEQILFELQKEQWLIQQFAFSTHFDFGPRDIFYPYAGRCFEDRAVQFLYKVCFYDRASQLMPSYPAHNVSLGIWTGLTSDFSQALFEGGDACDGHPNRSLRVFFQCSTEEKIHDTTEPNTCSYETHLDTPLACQVDEYLKIKASMEAMEAERNKIKAEIEAAAKDEL